MNIDPRNNAGYIYSNHLSPNSKAQNANSQQPRAAVSGDSEKIQLSALDKLRSEPEIRPEVVAKGKELLDDPNFPSQEMVNKIAKLITPFADGE